MIDLKLPKINAETMEGKINQMKSYLYQHVEELDYALSTIQKDQDHTNEVIEEVTNSDNGINTVMYKVNKLGKETTQLKVDAGNIKAELDGIYNDYTTHTEFEATTNGIRTTVSGIYADYVGRSEFTQTVTGFDLRVTEVGNLAQSAKDGVDDINADYVKHGELQVTADEIMAQVTAELDGETVVYDINYIPNNDKTSSDYFLYKWPSWDFTENVVCGVSACSDDLTFEYPDETLKKYARSVAYYQTDDGGSTFRFMRKDGEYIWNPVSEGDFGIAMARIGELQVRADQIQGTVYEQSLMLTDHGKEIEENQAQITQTSKAITQEVTERKNGEETLRGAITTTASAIEIEVENRESADKDLRALIRATTSAIDLEVTNRENAITGLDEELRGAIKTTASGIIETVDQKILEEDGSIKEHIRGELALKIDKNDNGQIVSMINASADEINLKGNRVSIESTNFTLDKNGNVQAKNLKISGGNIDVTTNVANRANAKFMSLKNGYSVGSLKYTDVMEAGPYGLFVYTQGGNVGKQEIFTLDSVLKRFLADVSDLSFTSRSGEVHTFTMDELGVCVDGKPILTSAISTWDRTSLSLASGQTKTLNVAGYKTLVLTGQLFGGDARQTVTISLEHITSSNVSYRIVGTNSSALAQLNARLSKSGNTLTIYASGSNLGTGAMWLFADLQK